MKAYAVYTDCTHCDNCYQVLFITLNEETAKNKVKELESTNNGIQGREYSYEEYDMI